MIARARMHTTDKSLAVNGETNKFPKQSYFILDLKPIYKKFPIHVRIFNETSEIREDIGEGKANNTCLINQNASLYALSIESNLLCHYFPLLHIIKKDNHLETRGYEGDMDEHTVKKIVAGFKCLGECTTKEYAQ